MSDDRSPQYSNENSSRGRTGRDGNRGGDSDRGRREEQRRGENDNRRRRDDKPYGGRDDRRNARNDKGDGRKHGQKRHAQRGRRLDDNDRGVRHSRSNPYREGFREERMAQKLSEPDLPGDIDIKDLDPMVLQDLRVLSKDNAERVGQHLIMSATLIEDDAQLALSHARAAKNRAGRVGVVREMNGIAAYHAGEWKEALSELRAARRMMGGPGLLAVMADCERGLGRPQKAIEVTHTPEARQLDPESRIELGIVAAGARRDLGQNDAAVATLQRLQPTKDSTSIPHMRLGYAYADALLAAGRTDEAKEWFEHVASIDTDELTDASMRVDELS